MAALKQQGITVSPGLVSNVKYSKPRAGGKTRRGRPPGRGRATGANGALTAADLIEAKRVVEQLGGIEQARQALATRPPEQSAERTLFGGFPGVSVLAALSSTARMRTPR